MALRCLLESRVALSGRGQAPHQELLEVLVQRVDRYQPLGGDGRRGRVAGGQLLEGILVEHTFDGGSQPQTLDQEPGLEGVAALEPHALEQLPLTASRHVCIGQFQHVDRHGGIGAELDAQRVTGHGRVGSQGSANFSGAPSKGAKRVVGVGEEQAR